ncbi:MAG: GNAT family N-acetyltransferase [Patescibacteria group bacterium]|mgnify:CR=1 FL=1
MKLIKPLNENTLDEFVVVLSEINEEPLLTEVIQRLKDDFLRNHYRGFLQYEDEKICGVAIVVEAYSAIHARKILILDELYIRKEFRQKGLGKVLFDHIVEYAKGSKFMRLEWRTEKGNITAQDFYSHYEADTDWIFYAMKL